VRHVTGIPHSPTGQAIVERANCTLKEYLEKQKQSEDLDVAKWLNRVLFSLNSLSLTEGREEPPICIHHAIIKENRPQTIPGLQVYHRNKKTREWEGP
ncbi:POK19 protein, partial [Vireo altiloquus]|nr:POK19 protein [Vireo altiloquus]